jgi:hypothetical protein
MSAAYYLTLTLISGPAMVKDSSENDPEDLSVGEMRSWLAQEVRDLTKSVELRAQEAIGIVYAYAAGEISAKEAGERQSKYRERWSEALPGVRSGEEMANKQILTMVNEARHLEVAKRLVQARDKLRQR